VKLFGGVKPELNALRFGVAYDGECEKRAHFVQDLNGALNAFPLAFYASRDVAIAVDFRTCFELLQNLQDLPLDRG
jgi:hypothetical protein